MKKIIILILFILLLPVSVSAEPKFLYDVLKNAAEEGTYAREYTGEHQDSMDASLSTKKIYHWYGEDDEKGIAITEKNNVVFGGICWQMIRTTDTGGVKLLYNGEAKIIENDNTGERQYNCSFEREDHFGIKETQLSLVGSYYYSNDYTSTFSNNQTIFKLVNPVQIKLTRYYDVDTVNEIIEQYPYTCKSTSATATCTSLTNVTRVEQKSGYYPNVYGYVTRRFGIVEQGTFGGQNRLFSVGYMYNKGYVSKNKSFAHSFSGLKNISLNYSTKYYFGTGITYNSTNNQYTLTGLTQSELYRLTASNGYYTCNSSTSSTCSSVYYFKDAFGSGYYGLEIKDGKYLRDYSLKVGKSYYTTTDGKHALNSVTTISIPDFFRNYNSLNYEGYYTCNNNESKCDNVKLIVFGYSTYYTYFDSGEKIVYSSSFTYDDSSKKYTLNDDRAQIWNTTETASLNSLKTHHYTCLSEETVCDTLEYVFYIPGTDLYYIELSSGTGIEDAVREMLFADDVNSTSSATKNLIDTWYQDKMIGYDQFVEETIFCNDRTIANYNSSGWNPNGGDPKVVLEYGSDTGLKCKNITDSFSVNNDKAKLDYSIGHITLTELELLGNDKARETKTSYWTMTPYNHLEFSSFGAKMGAVMSSGEISNQAASDTLGIRPSISLKPKIRYTEGNGSTTSPYVIDYNDYYNIEVSSNDKTGHIDFNIEDMESIAGNDITFSITPVEEYELKSLTILTSNNESVPYTVNNGEYTFTMPSDDVTIIPTYEKIKYTVDVEIKNETKDYEIEIEDLTNITMGDEVVFTITPVEGYQVNDVIIKDEDGNEIPYTITDNNEYKFTMPSSNITISPVYEKVSSEVNTDSSDLGEVTIEINDASAVVYDDVVVFTVKPDKGYKVDNIIIIDSNKNNIEYNETDNSNEYSFKMPASDVTITPTYSKVRNKINITENKNTKDLIIELDNSDSVEYETVVRFKVIPKDGYEVEDIIITDEENNKILYKKTVNDNEYEFIMPATSVTISPRYKVVDTSNVVIPDTWSSNIMIALSVLLIIGTFMYYRKKHLVK